MNRIVCGIFVFLLLFAAGPAMGQPQQTTPAAAQEEPSAGIQAFDALLVRPPCLVGSLISTALYMGISPLTYLMGYGRPTAHAMVEVPWRFTSGRYLGHFSRYKNGSSVVD